MDKDSMDAFLSELKDEDPRVFKELLPTLKEVDPQVYETIPTSIIKEESSNEDLKKEASAKVSFKDIQNEFTLFSRNTSVKTYGR